MTESAGTPVAGVKLFHDIEFDLFYRDEDHLCDTLAGLNLVGAAAAIPARYEYLSLVIGIDQSGQVSKNKSVLVSQARTRQQHRCERRIGNMYCQACRNQNCFAGIHGQGLVDASAHVETCRAFRRIVR